MKNQMPPGLAEAIAATSPELPPADALAQLTTLGRELHSLQTEIAERELGLAEAKQRANGLIHRRLPDLMAEMKLDHIGIEDLGVDVTATNFYKANISAEWDEEKRELAFKWLEENGFASLIKNDVTYSFRRGEEEKADWLVDLVRAATKKRAERLALAAVEEGRDLRPDETWDIPDPVIRKNVPHATLTAMVRQQTELPADAPGKKVLPLEILGAIVGRIVKIVPRDKK